jgi:xylulokinase
MGAGAFDTLNDILTEKDITTTYIHDFKNMDQYKESYSKWKNKLEQVISAT